MKYLGIDYVYGGTSIGIFDSSKKKFILKKFNLVNKTLGYLYYWWYKRSPNRICGYLIKLYVCNNLIKLQRTTKDHKVDVVVISSKSGLKPFTGVINHIKNMFKDKKVIHSDHFWGHINSVKYHKMFKYPALVVDSSARHSIIAYLPSDKKIEIVEQSEVSYNYEKVGLGIILINFWAKELNENIFWPGQPTENKKDVYKLYAERGERGNVVIDMKKEIAKSKELLCESVFLDYFPKKMENIKYKYKSVESYKNDWVATQQQLLRDVFEVLKKKISKTKIIKTCFVSGGISRNPAFLNSKEWLLTPNIMAGDDGAGCFMAYLGYHIEERGLVINHDKWKDYNQ